MPRLNLERILFATDFSPNSLLPLPYAAAIARRFKSTIYFAHVIPTDAFSLVPLAERDKALEKIRTVVQQRMAELGLMSVVEGIGSEIVVDHGDVWPALSGMIETHNIDFIVLGTNGRRGMEKLILGSVAEEVLRRSPIPILTVGPNVSTVPAGWGGLQSILYATDFSPESELAMHYACSLAKQYGATLSILHVTEELWKAQLETGKSAANVVKERMVERNWTIKEEDLSLEYYFEFGLPSQRILEMSEKLQAQLIVLGVRGARHPRLAAHLPGPTAYDVLSQSHCPVLVIRGQS